MKPNYTDERGTITDLFVTKGYSITHITFVKGAIRGNHYHKKTRQYDYVVRGKFHVATPDGVYRLGVGDEIGFAPNEPHAYLALEDSEIISICKGVRVGSDFEKDTFRLKKPLI